MAMAIVEEDEQRILPQEPRVDPSAAEKYRLWTLSAVGAVCVVLCIALLVVLARRTPMRIATPECASLASEIVTDVIGLFPGNRARLLANFPPGLIYMAGAIERMRNADTSYQFRWLTGVDLVNVSVIIDVAQRNCTLFLPVPDFYAIVFDGLLWSLPGLQEQYQVNSAIYWNNMTEFLDEKVAQGHTQFYTYPGVQEHYNWTVDDTLLKTRINEERYVKSDQELLLMQLVADVSSDSHEEVMKRSKPGMYEFQVQALWEAQATYCGINRLAYPTILGGGPNGAFLHYELNSRQIAKEDMVLVDAGGYATDITRTWPASGKFSAKQLAVYNMVLNTQVKTIAYVRAGISWTSVSNFAAQTLCEELIQDVCVQRRLNQLFMPHGLGHPVGLDVHDINLMDVKVGSVWTVEPGVYFNPFVFQSAFANATIDAMLDKAKINLYANFGGVRIEDTLVVLQNGTRVMSSAPKHPKDIEAMMAR